MPKLKSECRIDSFRGEHRFLSNFYPAVVEFEGMTYTTSEHAYQAAKSTNVLTRIRIGLLPTPGDAKSEGRSLLLRPDWDRVKVEVMTAILRSKFAAGTDLAARLLATGSAELVEGNHWHDKIWGRCTCQQCGGEGENLLGRTLMRIRGELREAAGAKAR